MLRSRFFLKLFLGFAAAIVLATVLVQTFVTRFIESHALADIESGLRAEALLIADLAAPWLADSAGAEAAAGPRGSARAWAPASR